MTASFDWLRPALGLRLSKALWPRFMTPKNRSGNEGRIAFSSRFHGFGRIWRTLLLVLGLLLALLPLVYLLENDRGWRAWQIERARLLDRGEPLTWEALLPPAPPDEENLAAAPIYALLFETVEQKRPNKKGRAPEEPATREAIDRVIIQLSPPGYPRRTPPLMVWKEGKTIDLEAWARHFREPEQPEGVTARFPQTSMTAPAASQILVALELYSETFQAIETAARRPRCRFPVRYQDLIHVALPHWEVLRNHTEAVVLRGISRLHLGDTDGAMEDFSLAQRLADALREEPLLISHLVRCATLQTVVQLAYEGMISRRLTEEQLTAIQRQLAGVNLLFDWTTALRGDRILAIGVLEDLRHGRRSLEDIVVDGGIDPPLLSWLHTRWMPSGWFWRTMAQLSRLYQGLIEHAVDTNLRTVNESVLKRFQDSAVTSKGKPFQLVVQASTIGAIRSLERTASAQAAIHLACTAVALEQFRLRHDRYPETLEAMGPLTVGQRDPFDGHWLRYRCEGADTYLLYSIGPDRMDDGGRMEHEQWNRPSGDLRWFVPARTGGDRQKT